MNYDLEKKNFPSPLALHATRYTLHACRGFALIEVVVGAAITLVVLTGIVTTYGWYTRAESRNTTSLQATYLAEEGLEAARTLRDFGWSANVAPLVASTTYYFSWNGTRWVTTATPVLIDGIFTRTLLLSNVYRDAAQNIAGSGTLDPNTKKFTVTVSWGSTTTPNAFAGGTKFLSVYLTNLFNN